MHLGPWWHVDNPCWLWSWVAAYCNVNLTMTTPYLPTGLLAVTWLANGLVVWLIYGAGGLIMKPATLCVVEHFCSPWDSSTVVIMLGSLWMLHSTMIQIHVSCWNTVLICNTYGELINNWQIKGVFTCLRVFAVNLEVDVTEKPGKIIC